MKIVLDTNLIFSAILKPKSLISEIIQYRNLNFFAPEFLRIEINRHKHKLINLAKYTEEDFEYEKYFVFKRINFIDEFQIKKENLKFAANLVKDIDPKDFIFIALAKELSCKLWTGDKKLITGLTKKGYTHFITTKDIKNLIGK